MMVMIIFLFSLGGRCQTNDLLHDPNNYLFGNKQQNGFAHTFTSNGAIHFMKSYGQVRVPSNASFGCQVFYIE